MKPKIKLSGQDGNVFNLIGIASKALKRSGMEDKAKEMTTKCFAYKSYEDTIGIISDYCQVS